MQVQGSQAPTGLVSLTNARPRRSPTSIHQSYQMFARRRQPVRLFLASRNCVHDRMLYVSYTLASFISPGDICGEGRVLTVGLSPPGARSRDVRACVLPNLN